MSDTKKKFFICKSQQVPLWHKQNLTIDEMSVYTGIGRETIRNLTKLPEMSKCVFKVGRHAMIRRKKFEEFLEGLSSI